MGVPGGLPRGRLDESGIPPDFLSDVDVRKGFAYSFDYTKMLSESYMPGGAQQPATPVVPGMPFHNFGQEKYSMNLTKAVEHFKAAWGGQLWVHGFNMTICYIGQLRQKMCEIIKATVESLNSKFHIKMISVLGEYGQRLRAGELTIFQVGWLEDFPDPHNFVLAFMHSQGGFALFQRYANATVDTLIEAGVRELNQTRREQIYYDLQRIYHDECPSIPYAQSIQRRFERDWVQGWYYNPGSCGFNYFYAQWKELVPPAVVTSGSNVVDAVAVSDTLIALNATALGNVSVSRHDINIDGTMPEDTVKVKYVTVDLTLSRAQIVWPVEIRLYCTEEDIRSANVDESTLRMHGWNQTSREWMLQSDSRWVTPSDQQGYAGYVRAKTYQLDIFAALARPRGFTDLNKDGKVNILDIFIVAQAFGSKPGDQNWNQTADLNKDGSMNILDMFAVAWDFGKTV
jgi:hypothetical protein